MSDDDWLLGEDGFDESLLVDMSDNGTWGEAATGSGSASPSDSDSGTTQSRDTAFADSRTSADTLERDYGTTASGDTANADTRDDANPHSPNNVDAEKQVTVAPPYGDSVQPDMRGSVPPASPATGFTEPLDSVSAPSPIPGDTDMRETGLPHSRTSVSPQSPSPAPTESGDAATTPTRQEDDMGEDIFDDLWDDVTDDNPPGQQSRDSVATESRDTAHQDDERFDDGAGAGRRNTAVPESRNIPVEDT